MPPELDFPPEPWRSFSKSWITILIRGCLFTA
jgi:hypothetical protein